MQPIHRFWIARHLTLLRNGAVLLEKIKPATLELFISAAVYIIRPESKLRLPEERVAEVAQQIYKALSRKERKALPLAVEKVSRSPGDIEAWRDSLLRCADRVGLLVCGDIVTAVHELASTSEEKLDANEIDDIIRLPNVADLLRFAVDSDYLSLRRQLQL